MNLASISAYSRDGLPSPSSPAGQNSGSDEVSQLARARSFMTPKTNALFSDALLSARVGRATLASELNDQIRFRVDRRGTNVSDWVLQPDSPLAHALLESPAGAPLTRQLETAMSTIGPYHDRTNLKGFILPDDLEGVIAARAVALLEDNHDTQGRALRRLGSMGDTLAASDMLQAWRIPMKQRADRAGAWNGEGWITFLPHTARAMLLAAGAYAPHKRREAYLLDAKTRVAFLAGNGAHEVQHSVTDRTSAASLTWMEEGIANAFSRTPHIQKKLAHEAGITVEDYEKRLATPPVFNPGWGVYVRGGESTRAERSEKRERMYDRSQQVVRDLVEIAGAPMGTPAGDQEAFRLLQGRTLYYVPGRLADAIIKHNSLDPSVRDSLLNHLA